jgi:UDP-N-acetylglucosamine--N-acetylmuramyl-(pentapeptide) pyrophosphoryl-undecaprenol N-acetylglucosamine transferase
VSAPAISAALARKVPVIVHEQNVIPGLVVRMFARRVAAVALTQPLLKPIAGVCEVVGLPLRPRICLNRHEKYFHELGLDPERKVLFVFGGSQGARSLCMTILELAEVWSERQPDWQILLQTGQKNIEEVRRSIHTPNLVPVDHLHEIGKAYSCADVIVARSGATTCAELAAVGKPAILVPYPHATANHQELNAIAYLEKKPGVMIRESELTVENLDKAIGEWESQDARPMNPEERNQPLSNLLGLIAKYAKGGGRNGNSSESAA